MVVDPNPEELLASCKSLNKLGITNIVCVDSCTNAVKALKDNKDIDIVIADFEMEPGEAFGLLLCTVAKETCPGLLFVLVSKSYSCSVVLDSFRNGAEDILDKNRENDIENLMGKWINLAKQKNILRKLLNEPTGV
jgi:CheY-like chemotaxis protein